MGVIVPGTEAAAAGLGEQTIIEVRIQEQLAQPVGQRLGVSTGHGQAPATGGDFAERPVGAADAGSSMPLAFEDRQAETFAERWVHGERAIPIRLMQRVIADM